MIIGTENCIGQTGADKRKSANTILHKMTSRAHIKSRRGNVANNTVVGRTACAWFVWVLLIVPDTAVCAPAPAAFRGRNGCP